MGSKERAPRGFDEGDENEGKRKGPAKRLSREERAAQRALGVPVEVAAIEAERAPIASPVMEQLQQQQQSQAGGGSEVPPVPEEEPDATPPSRIPDSGQAWIEPTRYVASAEEAEAPAAAAPAEAPKEEKKISDKDELDSRVRRVLEYRRIGISYDEIIKNQEELGLTPDLVAKAVKKVKSIEKSRAAKTAQKLEEELREAKTSSFIERKETAGVRASLGQVETKSGAAWREPKEEAPLGRERTPYVPVDEGPMIQVETQVRADEVPEEVEASADGDNHTMAPTLDVAALEAEEQAAIDKRIAEAHHKSAADIEDVPFVEKPEGTRREWQEKLRSLIKGAKEGVGHAVERMGERFTNAKEYMTARSRELGDSLASKFTRSREAVAAGKEKAAALKKYLRERDFALGEKAKTLGKGTAETLKSTGEWYRKLPLKYKIGVSAALIGTTILTGGGSTFVTVLTSSAMLGQRALGSLGVYTLVEGSMEKLLSKEDRKLEKYGIVHERNWQDSAAKNIPAVAAALFVFSGLPGFVIKEGFEVLGGSRVTEWLGNVFGHHAAPSGSASPTNAAETRGAPPAAPRVESPASEVARPAAPAPAAHPAASAPQPAVSGEVTHPAPEAPAPEAAKPPAVPQEAAPAAALEELTAIDVKASKGHGYEYMTKRLWEQLQEKNITLPSGANPNTDLARLLAADKESIDAVVHQLAQENEFFKQTGASVRINLDSHMSIDSSGNIILDGMDRAPADSPVTPALPVGDIEKVDAATSLSSGESLANESIEATASSGTAEATGTEALTQAPAPVTNHDFVVNKFEVAVPLAEPHTYTGADGKVFAYGGEKMARLNEMFNYLKGNPGKTIIAADDSEKFRAVWSLDAKGQMVQGELIKKPGISGMFGTLMAPPDPAEFTKLIK